LRWFVGSTSIWFVHFAFLYSLAGFGSAFGITPFEVKLFGWISIAIAPAGVVGIVGQTHRRARINDDSLESMSYISNLMSLLSLVAIMLQALVFWLAPY